MIRNLFAAGIFCAAMFAAPARSFAGNEHGNGGGAWVCRETSGEIRWIQLVDFFEAVNQYGLTLSQFDDVPYNDTVNRMMGRLYQAKSALYDAAVDYFDSVNDLRPNPPKVQVTHASLEVIDDALYLIKPDVRSCAGGVLVSDPRSGGTMVPYEQVVNYGPNNILVQSELFDHLANTAKAALVLHEIIYKYRREQAGDQSSNTSRAIVALLFSTLSGAEFRQSLIDLQIETSSVPSNLHFSAIPLRNGCPASVTVPAGQGCFLMGSPFSDADQDNDEEQHAVVLRRAFELQATDVTQDRWFRVMGSNPSPDRNATDCPESWRSVEDHPGITLCPNHSVTGMTADDVQTFLARLNRFSIASGSPVFGIPTEAEWEYSARAGGAAKFFWQDIPLSNPVTASELAAALQQTSMATSSAYARIDAYAWHDQVTPQDVGLLLPNAWGLYDMEGNVSQLVCTAGEYHPSVVTVDDPGSSSACAISARGGTQVGPRNSLKAFRSAARGENSSRVGLRLLRTSHL